MESFELLERNAANRARNNAEHARWLTEEKEAKEARKAARRCRCCRAIRNCVARQCRRFREWFRGRSIKFYFVSAVICSTLAFLSFLGLAIFLMRYYTNYTNAKYFISLKNHTIEYDKNAFGTNSDESAFITNDDFETCLHTCMKEETCLTAVYDPGMEYTCSLFTFTPFFLNRRPVAKAGATIFVHRRALLGGKLFPDGYYYWLTPAPFPAHKLEMHCEMKSDFYFLAIEGPETSNYLSEVFIPNLRKLTDAYAKVILWRIQSTGNNRSTIIKTHVRFGDSLEYVGDEALGYGLCQGDPFNKEGGAHLRRILIQEPETAFEDF